MAVRASSVGCSAGTHRAKKPPKRPPARARGRSRWLEVLEARKSMPAGLESGPQNSWILWTVSLWPSKMGILFMICLSK